MLCITAVHNLSMKEDPGDAPTFQKEQPGQEMGGLQDGVGIGMQQ